VADHILAIDEGTTSTRALVFDRAGRPVGIAQREIRQFYPADGWVEHDPEEIWTATRAVCRDAVAKAGLTAADMAAIGITNQRETTLLWDRRTGEPIHDAIVWQDRRTAELCRDLVRDGVEKLITARTGLVVDPYFSASKLTWLLDHVPGARERAEKGELAFGTIDSFLLFRLTGRKVHATDATNASRTSLYDIARQDWDEELLRIFRVPAALLPRVLDSAADFGVAGADFLGAPVPVLGVAGDQQASLIGQGCFAPGMIKSTFGTGCFTLMNVGERPVASKHRLLTTIGYRLNGKPAYALEGAIFAAGVAVQWLRDGLKLIENAVVSEAMAAGLDGTGGVYLVPAFTGLGAPHWAPTARGAILGITRDTRVEHVVRAALESVCYQMRDLMDAMADDGGVKLVALRVDGGMTANNWMLQFLADMLDLPVERPAFTETTALGAACLAAFQAGFCASPAEFGAGSRLDRRFEPAMGSERRDVLYQGWQQAVARVLARV
jgi:glycerol kinase